MLSRFYWLIEGVLAGGSRPGASGAGRRGPATAEHDDSAQDALDLDLAWLRGQGIGAILSLTETALPPEILARHELETLHLPVPDLCAPAPDDLMHALTFIDRQRASGRAVVVHCLVGQGRTGTVLAAHRIRSGARPEEALRELRAICPGAVGSPEQERALFAFAARRDWLL